MRCLAGAAGLTILGVLIAGCSTPSLQRLEQFPATSDLAAETRMGEIGEVKACRLGESCLNDIFRTVKVGQSFIIFWVDLTVLCATPVRISRNEMWLNLGDVKIFPVDPARVAYIAKLDTAPGASLALLFWPAAALAVGGTDSANKKRLRLSGANAFPTESAIPPGSTLSGLVYFEPPIRKNESMQGLVTRGGLQLSVSLKSGEKREVLVLRDIPLVNLVLGKEGKPDAKKY